MTNNESRYISMSIREVLNLSDDVLSEGGWVEVRGIPRGVVTFYTRDRSGGKDLDQIQYHAFLVDNGLFLRLSSDPYTCDFERMDTESHDLQEAESNVMIQASTLKAASETGTYVTVRGSVDEDYDSRLEKLRDPPVMMYVRDVLLNYSAKNDNIDTEQIPGTE